jgi:hypothetical protein
MQASSFIETIEERQGLKASCIEEIAYRMGYITSEQLEKLAIPFGKNGYGKYLLDLLIICKLVSVNPDNKKVIIQSYLWETLILSNSVIFVMKLMNRTFSLTSHLKIKILFQNQGGP